MSDGVSAASRGPGWEAVAAGELAKVMELYPGREDVFEKGMFSALCCLSALACSFPSTCLVWDSRTASVPTAAVEKESNVCRPIRRQRLPVRPVVGHPAALQHCALSGQDVRAEAGPDAGPDPHARLGPCGHLRGPDGTAPGHHQQGHRDGKPGAAFVAVSVQEPKRTCLSHSCRPSF